MFSTTKLVPSAVASRLMKGAWMSVGKPGKGWVVKSTARIRSAWMERPPSTASRRQPASSSLVITAPRCSGTTGPTNSSERVMAPASRKVAASIRSGITE